MNWTYRVIIGGMIPFVIAAIGCDNAENDGSSGESGSTGMTTIENACGVFTISDDEPGDSVVPQDPDDPQIIQACSDLCEQQLGANIEGCDVDMETCVESCSLRSCDVCPGTLVPLVSCEAAHVSAETCQCTDDGIMCDIPAECGDEADAVGFCGG